MGLFGVKTRMPAESEALPGRQESMAVPTEHFVNGASLVEPFPEDAKKMLFGMGCFWGAERKFWEVKGVITTAVGYAAGFTPNPTYEEVCSGRTGHNEVVLAVWNPDEVTLEDILRVFWESHNPTQGMGQGNDTGTQYRSGIYAYSAFDLAAAEESRTAFQSALGDAGYGEITTEISQATRFYYAEHYHQQYLAKNPAGYCGIGGTGVSCPIGVATITS